MQETTASAVTIEMIEAGMKEWDAQHKAGERSWPPMLEKVFLAMQAAAATTPARLPEGVRISLAFYFTSDETGLNTVISANHGTLLPAMGGINPGAFKRHLPPFADDWRPMNAAEIKAYLKEREDSRDDDEVADHV